MTDKQEKFIEDLMDQREVPSGFREAYEEARDRKILSTAAASAFIESLLALPRVPKKGSDGEPVVEGPPAGRYAIESRDGVLTFYHVWRPDGMEEHTSGPYALFLLHGPERTRLRGKTASTIMEDIVSAGVQEAAIRYGHEIGACAICGRRLTNEISRERGIGPVCAEGRGW